MVLTNPMPVHDVYWCCLKTSAGFIFTVILASCQWGYLLCHFPSSTATQRIKQNFITKQTRRDRNETAHRSKVASFTQTEMEGRGAAVLLAHTETELTTAALTDPLFDQLNGKRSSSIFQHHYNYLAKVSDTEVPQNTDENADGLFSNGEHIRVICASKKQVSKITVCDMLYYGHSGSMYGLYNFPSRGSRCREMVIHNACILHCLSVWRWGGWRLVRLKSEEGEGSNCWCRSH